MKYNKKNVDINPTDTVEIEEPIEAEILEQEVIEETDISEEVAEEADAEVVDEPIVEAPKSQTYVVVGGALNLRSGANKQASVVKVVPADTKLDILEIKTNAAEGIDYGFIPSESAWVNMSFVK